MPQKPKQYRPGRRSTPQTAVRPNSTARGYGYRWQQRRKLYLDEHPLCVMCQAEGRVEAATVVDHRIPHRGDESLFWDEGNWQALCKLHHDRKTGGGE